MRSLRRHLAMHSPAGRACHPGRGFKLIERLDCQPKLQRRQARTAFTLIELLVVIAIISLLVSILLPSLQKAKDLARQVACQSQLRSIGMGIVFYSEENDSYIPIATDAVHSGHNSRDATKRIWTDDLCEYDVTPASGMFRCPADENPLTMSDTTRGGWVGLYDQPGHDGEVSYAYNLHYGTNYWGAGHDHSYYPQQLSKLNHPDKAMIVIDGNTSAWPGDTFTFYVGGNGVKWRHTSETFNAFFGDLSVQNQAWDAYELRAGRSGNPVYYADWQQTGHDDKR